MRSSSFQIPEQGVHIAMHRRSLAVLVCVLVAAAIAPAAASAWAPAATATVHPGVMTYTEGAQCTANFVFSDASNTYIGQAAHCSGTGTATETDGCDSASLPLGTARRGQRRLAARDARLQLVDRDAGQGRDGPRHLRVQRLRARQAQPGRHGKVNPSIPKWGGPNAVGATTALRDKVYSYGNSSLRQGITQLSPKEGYSLGDEGGGWTHTVYTLTPGIPGDSGSAFLSKDGAALGTLSTVAIAPITGSNGVGDIAKELNYMKANSAFSGVSLALGTEPFVPGSLP